MIEKYHWSKCPYEAIAYSGSDSTEMQFQYPNLCLNDNTTDKFS